MQTFSENKHSGKSKGICWILFRSSDSARTAKDYVAAKFVTVTAHSSPIVEGSTVRFGGPELVHPFKDDFDSKSPPPPKAM
ncbi:hypothetical protein HDV03_004601, partial [Kappamyces sp. JEL0829]